MEMPKGLGSVFKIFVKSQSYTGTQQDSLAARYHLDSHANRR